MQNWRKKGGCSDDNFISFLKVILYVINEAFEILLFRAVVEREDDNAGGNKKDEEDKFEPQKPSYRVPFDFHTLKREKKGDQEEGKEVDEVPGGDKVGDMK